MKQKFSIAMSLAVILAMLLTSMALADAITADADALVLSSPHPNGVTTTQASGTTVSYNFSAAIANSGGSSNDVFPGSISVTISKVGAWLSGGTSGPWTFTDYDAPEVGAIQITIPCGSQGTTNTMTVDLQAGNSSNGKSLSPDSQHLSWVITAGSDDASCAPSNTAPEVDVDNASVTVDEGDTATNSGTYFDADGDDVTLTASIGDIVNNGDGTWDWSLNTTDGPDNSQTVTITADDGQAQSSVTFDLTVNNVKPTPAIDLLSGNSSAACIGGNTVTLDFSWTDPAGTNDNYNYDVDWGDSSTHATATNATSAVTGLTHTYAAGGPYTISVTVNDDDSGAGNTVSSAPFSFLYNTSGILQPINLTGTRSSFKIGSTIPVKLQVTDCNGTPVSGLTLTVHLALEDSTTVAVNELVSTSAADTGTTMRFSDNLYIFNLSTKRSQFNAGQDLTSGSYHIWITGDGIAQVDAHFDARK